MSFAVFAFEKYLVHQTRVYHLIVDFGSAHLMNKSQMLTLPTFSNVLMTSIYGFECISRLSTPDFLMVLVILVVILVDILI